ncbi:putative MFS transporter [Hypoxylon trugodes]|uniref:putative MFS transporter n=1 Tax=Hypoxylon trugodes TaxID=326681 RepID=UPI00219B40F2|nr:putative MFS transporter [Hypoxylon trugodes]KAI1390801.1 putative MFS transporter [Hypoxylon trugodes]
MSDTQRTTTEQNASSDKEARSGSVELVTPPEPASPPEPVIVYPGLVLSVVLNFALLLAMFLVALDMSIIATAIPTITAEFHSVDQTGWYGSAFFLGLAAFQAFWGKAYKHFSLKIVFLTCIGLFEIGSLIVAVSPNSTCLIVGRAVQGMGGAGVTGGVYTLLTFITRPEHRPAVLGLSSVVWSCSSVLGPVLGGVFTQYVTWRWCFWINLPIGGTTMLLVLFFFKTPAHSRVAKAKLSEIPFLFDIPGILILLGAMTCLLLVLEEGGVDRPWNSGFVIGLLVAFGVLMIILTLAEWKQGEKAMVVPRIMKRRSIIALGLFNLTAQGSGFARTYNLPIYFQAAQLVSASESGVRTLPTVLTTSIFSFLGSLLLGKVGYYQPFLFIGGIFVAVGSGMIYTLEPNSTAGQYIGYQVLAAIGSGLVIQVNVIVAQAFSSRADIAVTVAIVLLWQFVGGTIGVSAAQNIMNNVILQSLPTDNPNLSPSAVLAAGSGDLRALFPDPDDLNIVVNAYMRGLKAAWIWSIALSSLAVVISLGAEWKSVRADDVKKRAESKAAKAVADA